MWVPTVLTVIIQGDPVKMTVGYKFNNFVQNTVKETKM